MKTMTPTRLTRLLLSSLTWVTALTGSIAWSSPRDTITLSADLVSNTNDAGYSGTVDIRVRLFAAETGGVATWQECWDSTAIASGRVSLALGSRTPFSYGGVTSLAAFMGHYPNLWAEITICDSGTACGSSTGAAVCDDPLSPRIALTSVPYAGRAGAVDGFDATKFTTLTGGGDAGTLHNHDGAYLKKTESAALAAGKTFGLGSFTSTQESTITSGGGGQIYYNSDTNEVKFFDGSNRQSFLTSTLPISSSSKAPLTFSENSSLTGITARKGSLEFAAGNLYFSPADGSRYAVCTYDNSTAPTVGQTLNWDGSKWRPGNSWSAGTANSVSYTAGNVGIGGSNPAALLHLNGNTTTFPGTLPANTPLLIMGANSASATAHIYGFNSQAGLILGQAGGTAASPASPVANTPLGGVIGKGWDPSTVSFATGAGIQFVTEQSWNASVHDAAMVVMTTSGTTPSEKMRVSSLGRVGIGTTNPAAKLDISGGQVRTAAFNLNGSTTVNWNNSNTQYTGGTNGCAAFSLQNMLDGANYTLAVNGTTGTCTFNAYSDSGVTSLTVHMLGGETAPTISSPVVFSFLRTGNDVFVTWVTF